ncbi:serine protease H3 [Tribolium castaneum]|uniref:Phenoloxidase-activating factor 2 n=2 Tax=Tribolium castaneum TaxID=7070 RepID=D6WBS9_TRICA|nr:serine protease H3 [Tribolium castaneum]
MGGFGAQEKCGEGSKVHFKCVPYHRCDGNTNTIIPEEEDTDTNDYSLLIDIRLGVPKLCSKALDVCCQIPNTTSEIPPTTKPQPTDNTPKPQPTPNLSFCGIRNNNGIDFKITGNSHNEAEYGEFPWMVAVLKKNYDPSVDQGFALCGGSLIAPRVILTGAHCVHKFKPEEIKIRAGEWDTQTEDERFPYQERQVEEIIIHEAFKDGTLLNDVALIVLEKPFLKAKHIGTVCLPNQDQVISSQECFGTGWGKNAYGSEGQYQMILKKIELPIVPHAQCETALRKTKLGNFFKLHKSFTCAGGIPGRDTCTGDGGSPLVCPDPENPARYIQAGIVAWGVGCGTTTPGVYADVAKFRGWVDAQMERLELSNKPYTT